MHSLEPHVTSRCLASAEPPAGSRRWRHRAGAGNRAFATVARANWGLPDICLHPAATSGALPLIVPFFHKSNTVHPTTEDRSGQFGLPVLTNPPPHRAGPGCTHPTKAGEAGRHQSKIVPVGRATDLQRATGGAPPPPPHVPSQRL